jgi:hypothetical protein
VKILLTQLLSPLSISVVPIVFAYPNDTEIFAAADPGALLATDKLPIARSGSSTIFAASMAEIAAYAAGGNLSITLNWAGGVVVADGTYLFAGSSAYPFAVSSLDASVGSAGGTMTATVRNAGATCGGLGALAISVDGKTNFPASGGSLEVLAGAVLDVVLTVTGAPTDAYLTLNGIKT